MIKWIALLALLPVTFIGCGERRSVAPTTGSYGPPSGKPASKVARARVDRSAETPWTNGTLKVIETELSPASLWHSTSRTLSFFANMPQTGIGGPSYVCISTEQGPKIFQHGANIDPARLRESWFVVWFAGASGWTNWDSPWFLTLQHRPEKIRFDTNGLHFEFPREAGYAALMPMYGYYKPLAAEQGNHPFLKLKEKKKRILTWEWSKALPADPLARARYWASALREFPVYCEDSFSIDRAHDDVVLRQKFRFVSWNDDWNTKHLKLAPVSPALALAYHEGFPAEFSNKPFDMEVFTPFGPLYGVEGADSYDVTLPVLRYVNETEVIDGSLTNRSTVVRTALQKLRETTSAVFSSERFPRRSGCAAIHDAEVFAKALPWMDAATRSNAMAKLKEVVAATATDPKCGSMEMLWAFAHFTGDWESIRAHWPEIKARFTAPSHTRWAGCAQDNVPALSEQATPSLCFARLAYKMGDMDSYNYACQMFARDVTHHWVKQRGARYFRENQPYHSMAALDDSPVAMLQGDLTGWRLSSDSETRWRGFGNEDVARFHRDLLPDVKRELEMLMTRWPGERRWSNDPDGLPSLLQLRSLLLNETPAQLASNAPPEKFSGPPAGVVANCLSVLRRSQPLKFERLIPGGEASPFVAGIERDVNGPNVVVTQQLGAQTNDSTRITWPAWKTPTDEAWNFGEVTTSTNAPARTQSIPLNWNSRVTVFR